jgi:hypothetical protein
MTRASMSRMPVTCSENEIARFEHLLAAEREELPGERCPALYSLGNRTHDGRKFRIIVKFFDQHFRISDDHSQNVVEIVSDASGEPPNGFHFLNVAKSLFNAAHV